MEITEATKNSKEKKLLKYGCLRRHVAGGKNETWDQRYYLKVLKIRGDVIFGT